MPPKHAELFNHIVFTVSCIIYGDETGSLTVYQNIVREALMNRELDHVLESYVENDPTAMPPNIKIGN